MALLKEKERNNLAKMLKGIENDVRILMFTQKIECQPCEMTRLIVEEISSLGERLSLSVHDFLADADLARQYGIDKIPAVILAGEKDYGIRFYGTPAGYEFPVLIEDMLDVGRRSAGLSRKLLTELAKVDQGVHLQVFISPT